MPSRSRSSGFDFSKKHPKLSHPLTLLQEAIEIAQKIDLIDGRKPEDLPDVAQLAFASQMTGSGCAIGLIKRRPGPTHSSSPC